MADVWAGDPSSEEDNSPLVCECGNKDDAAAIVAAMNSLPALLECASALATVRGCDVLPLVLARIADEALDALALAEGGGK
jgi:hypothetical protein